MIQQKAFGWSYYERPAGLGAFAGQGYYSALPSLAPPGGHPSLGSVQAPDSDPVLILKRDAEIKKRFADLFGG